VGECAREIEREKERERGKKERCVCSCMHACMLASAYVCLRARVRMRAHGMGDIECTSGSYVAWL